MYIPVHTRKKCMFWRTDLRLKVCTRYILLVHKMVCTGMYSVHTSTYHFMNLKYVPQNIHFLPVCTGMYSVHTRNILEEKSMYSVHTWGKKVKSMYQVHTGLCRYHTIAWYIPVRTLYIPVWTRYIQLVTIPDVGLGMKPPEDILRYVQHSRDCWQAFRRQNRFRARGGD